MHTFIYLIRHGETVWTQSGQHTSYTDLELTEAGKRQAACLQKPLKGIPFEKVYCSPSLRARQTCDYAGFRQQIEIDPHLAEWNYGRYEGLTSAEIMAQKPDWLIFKEGAPGGESPKDIEARADKIIEKALRIQGYVALFSSGHFSRALAARFIQQPLMVGARLFLSTASISILGFERKTRVIRLWNDTSHIAQ